MSQRQNKSRKSQNSDMRIRTDNLFKKVASSWGQQERRKKPRDYKSYTCCPLCGKQIAQSRKADILLECEKCHAKIVVMVEDHIVVTFPSRRRQDYQTEKQVRQYLKKLAGVISECNQTALISGDFPEDRRK